MYVRSDFPGKCKGCRCGGKAPQNEELKNCTETLGSLLMRLEMILTKLAAFIIIEKSLREAKNNHKGLKKQIISNMYNYWYTVQLTATLQNYVSNQIMCMNSHRNHKFSASACTENSFKKCFKVDHPCKVAKGRKKKHSLSANPCQTSSRDYSKTVNLFIVSKERKMAYKASKCAPNMPGNNKKDYPNNSTTKINGLNPVSESCSVAHKINLSFLPSKSIETGVNRYSSACCFLTKKTNDKFNESNYSETGSKDESKTNNCCSVAHKINYSLIPSITTEAGVKNDTKADNVYSVLVRAPSPVSSNNVKDDKGTPSSDSSHAELSCCMEELVRTQRIWIKPYVLQVLMVPEVKTHPSEVNCIPWNHLKSEKWRLITFSRYPHNTNKSAILLAAAGFAYIGSGKGNDDLVICCFCCVPKSNWLPTDDIMEVHSNLSPSCSIITKRNCDNIPLQTHSIGNFDAILSQLNHNELLDTNKSHSQRNRGEMANIDTDGDDIEADAADVEPTTATTKAESYRYGPAGSSSIVSSSFSSEKEVPFKESGGASVGSTGNSRPSNVPIVPMINHAGMISYSSENQPGDQPTTVNGRSTQTTSNTFSAQTGSIQPHQSLINPTGTTHNPSSDLFQNSTQASGAQNPINATGNQNSTRTTYNQNSTGSAGTQSLRGTTSSQILTGTSESALSNSQIPAGSSENTQNSTGTAAPATTGRGPTYGELGIITERPKRIEYAVKTSRLSTFDSWPRDHHLKKEDLADAGFYYAGYGDCARCFYCGGGLRNWENEDNVWVEHARWFPKCAHIRQTRGQQFVDAVQDLNKVQDKISLEMVREKLGNSSVAVEMDYRKDPLRRDPAVLTVKDLGYTEEDILEVAKIVKETSDGFLSADILFERLQKLKKARGNNASLGNLAQKIQVDPPSNKPMDKLKEENSQLRQQTACKVCMDKEVAVVFLPCGHLVCCADCASAMKDCPVCRKAVRGIVRAFMG